MPADGIELATEWVTILPETATLVKELKKFKPPPIEVEVELKDRQMQREAKQTTRTIDQTFDKATERTGKKVGENLTDGIETAEKRAKKTDGEKVFYSWRTGAEKTGVAIVKTVDKATKDAGETIKKNMETAGKEGMDKLGRAIESKKSAVAKAERAVADARRNEANIESRINQIESRIQQSRDATARHAKKVAEEEAIANNMRANSAKHTAEQIQAQEARVIALQDQQQARMTRMAGLEEQRTRLTNTQENAANRTANAVDNLGLREAALATALSAANDPLDDQKKKTDEAKRGLGGITATLIPLGRQMLITSGIFTGALGVGGLVTDVLRTGNQFNDSMNTIRGILRATPEEMAALSAKARDLGRDMNLPMATANGAAAAMLELSRAGFTVQQSMDAARGSLQLAAAANISEAEAAKITGVAINSFGLQATDAAAVTDLLANAANQFPGEMTDFGYSLSQAGAVAKSFGNDIYDTTTAIGILAKEGIKSSDAGTLIKTMLLSLTDEGKPAQEAIRTLGLEIYDANKQFVGIESIFKQLTQASADLDDQTYQTATATLFGTDAARFAGAAANKTADYWDKLRAGMNETGSAAAVSDARMQGMVGAIERVKNAWQSLALTLYDAIKGPLTAVLNAIAKVILAIDEWIRTDLVKWIKDHKEEIIGVAAVLGTYVAVLGAIKLATMAWTAVQWLLNAALNANPIGLIVLAIAALVGAAIWAYKNVDWFREGVNKAWDWIKRATAAAWPVIKMVLGEIGKAFTWVWNNVLKPFGEWLVGTFFPKYWGFVKFMWSNVWQPVFKAIGTGVAWLWNNVLKPFGSWLITNWPKMWEGIKFAWNNVIKPTWEFIKMGAQNLWNILKIAWGAISAEWKVLWFAIQVGWEIGKRVFNAVGDTVKWLWNNVLSPIWEAIKGGWGLLVQAWNWGTEQIRKGIDFWADGIKWLWHTILEPAWEAIKAGFSAVWDFLQPVFDKFKEGIKAIGDVAKSIADGIKSAWSGLANILKLPLKALGVFLAGIPDSILGVEVPFIADIHDWGQKLAALATGGIAGRSSSGLLFGPGTGTSDDIIGLDRSGLPTARVSAGEGVVPANALATPLGRMLFGMLLKMAGGGKIPEGALIWPPQPIGPTDPTRPGGVPDLKPGKSPNQIALPDWGTPGQGFGTPPPGWWDKPINRDDVLFPEWMPPGMRENWLDKWGDRKRKWKFLKGYNTGGVVDDLPSIEDLGIGSEGNLRTGTINMARTVAAAFPEVQTIGGYRQDPLPGHPSGRAIDIMVGNNTALGDRINSFLHTYGSMFGLKYTIWKQFYKPVGGTGNLMKDQGNKTANHFDHVHAEIGDADIKPSDMLGDLSQGSSGGISRFRSIANQVRNPGGGRASATFGGGGEYVAPTEKQIREQEDRISDRTNQLELAQQRLQEFLDKQAAGETVKESTIQNARNQVDKFQRELDQAKSDLETLKQGKWKETKEGSGASGGQGGNGDWNSVGGMIFNGFLEALGIDGSVFANMFEWPTVKSALAGFNWGMSVLDTFMNPEGSGGGTSHGGSGAAPGPSGDPGAGFMGIGADMLAGIGDAAGIQAFPPGQADQAAAGGGVGGTNFDLRGSTFGYDKNMMQEETDKITASNNRHPTLGPVR